MRRIVRRYFPIIFIFSLIVLGVLIGLFYKNNISYKNPDSIAQSQARLIVERVGKLVFLPEGETPTIATVSDPDLLKGQQFFEGAKKGDQVLIYSNSKKAILYDPVANKIVNIATLNVGDTNNPAPLLPALQGESTPNNDSTNRGQF